MSHITLARAVPRCTINEAAVNSINLNRGGRTNIGTPFGCQRLPLRWMKSSGDEKDGVQSLELFSKVFPKAAGGHLADFEF